jgi:signal transduction histidine kinase
MANNFSNDVEAISKIGAVEKILEVICRSTGVGFAAVARVTESRWIACAVRDEISFGLTPGGELPIATTFCNEVRAHDKVIAIDHVATDETYRSHPIPQLYGFQSYISVPIRSSQRGFFGTLCAIDLKPIRLNSPERIGMFLLFADLIGLHLDLHERLSESQSALLNERETANFREQFIAILGHDLRNPLLAIDASVATLTSAALDESSEESVALIKKSSARMAEILTDVMDFTRGRLGGGLSISPRASEDLGDVLEHIISELRTTWPDRRIDADIQIRRTVTCDASRIGQLLSNLVENAAAYGDIATPVEVTARADADIFQLTVTNQGEPIPPDALTRLFQPFFRVSDDRKDQGLGLGLYIAHEIARAHHGTLKVQSAGGETRFTFQMPCGSNGKG